MPVAHGAARPLAASTAEYSASRSPEMRAIAPRCSGRARARVRQGVGADRAAQAHPAHALLDRGAQPRIEVVLALAARRDAAQHGVDQLDALAHVAGLHLADG